MLIDRLQAELHEGRGRSRRGRCRDCSPGAAAGEKPRSTMKAKIATMIRQTMRPSSSPATAKTKSACASGSDSFTVPSLGRGPRSPPFEERVDRAIDLIAVAGLRIEEAVDACRDMRQQHISAGETGDARAHQRDDPDQRQAGEEELREPHDRDDRGHAEIGLLDEQANDQHVERDRDRIARGSWQLVLARRATPRRRRNTASRIPTAGSIRSAALDPAPRAFDLDSVHQRIGEQHDIDRETGERNQSDRAWAFISETVNITATAIGRTRK